jgi:hypothetical protein
VTGESGQRAGLCANDAAQTISGTGRENEFNVKVLL